MKPISISQPVWEAIASRGKFGETEDDVLRRVFGLPPREPGMPVDPKLTPRLAHRSGAAQRRSFATDKLTSYISGNELRISFASGPSNSWRLPPKDDKTQLRSIRDQATSFAKEHGATVGQVNAVRKTLTEAGYHLMK